MNSQNFFENMVNALLAFQADYKNESANLSDDNKENLVNSIIVAYDVVTGNVCADYCDGRCSRVNSHRKLHRAFN